MAPSTSPINYRILSWEEIYNATLRLSERIAASGFDPEVIVGIARGGWIPARILSDVLFTASLQNIRIEYYSDIGVHEKAPRITQPISGSITGKRVLLVDEVADTGESLRHAIQYVNGLSPESLVTGVPVLKPESIVIPDHRILKIDAWVVFPWEHRESIISLVKFFQSAIPGISMEEIREKLVFEVGFDPSVTDYFIARL